MFVAPGRLADGAGGEGKGRGGGDAPLLYRLATEERYLGALRCFEGRVTYANVFNDMQVCLL